MAASSFAGVNIRVELETTTASGPTWERPGYTTTRHIPASNDDVIQVLGLGHGVLTVRLLVDPTEWLSLSGELLETGALVIAGVAYGNALLEALAAPMVQSDGWVTVQATFRKTAAG